MTGSRPPRRPGLVAGVVFAAGVWCVSCVGDSSHLAMLLGALGVSAVALRHLLRVPGVGAIWLLVFAAGMLRAGLVTVAPPAASLSRHPSSNGEVLVSATVVSEPEVRLRHTRYLLDLHTVAYPESLRVRTGRLLARFPHDPGFEFGEQVQLRGCWEQAGAARNPGDFDYARFLRLRGIDALWVPVRQGSVLARSAPEDLSWVGDVVAPVRGWIRNRFTKHLTGEPLALVFGLLFGETSAMADSTVDAFEVTGTLHLLAVSGSNVAIVVGVVWGCLTFLRIRGWWRAASCLVAIVLFCDLAHGESSVVRASVAAALVIAGRLAGRVPDALNIWGGSLLLLLLWEPRQLHEVGFQLSYLATLGILMFYPPLHRTWTPRKRWARSVRVMILAAWVSIAAQLTTLPILAEVFHRVPIVTPVSNLVCVPAASLVTAAGSAAVLAALASDWLFGALCAITWLTARALLWSVHFFAGWSAPVWDPDFGASMWVAYGGGLLLAYLGWVHPYLRRRALLGVAAVVCIVSWAGVLREQAAPQILILDCGPRSASLLRWPDGSTWWIAPRGDVRDYRYRRTIRDVATRQKWSAPERIWLLEDGTPTSDVNGSVARHRGTAVRGGGPGLRVRSPSAGGNSPWVVHAQLAGAGLDLARLELDGPAAKVVWLSHGRRFEGLRLTGRDRLVILVPDLATLPVGSAPLPASVQLVETSTSSQAAATVRLPSGRILRTRDTGALLIHGLHRDVRSEASIR